MKFETIKYEKKGKIAIVTLNREKVYNAINGLCRDELQKTLDDSAGDGAVHALIITGHENFFCAGADINEVLGLENAILANQFSRNFQKLFQNIEEHKKPVLAAVSGFALGGGFELALACDVRILSENSSFGFSEINIGAFPAGGGTQKLPRLIGAARAKELLFTGDKLSSQEAYALGLANNVVPDGECLKETIKWAEKLTSKSPSAISAIKQLVNTGLNMDLNSSLIFESETFGSLSTHRDFKEGVSAFLDKRKPVYRGD